ncbi:siroheme synthase CysG [Elongatibacter sediminis]|uniref:Siroheme synthase CysG n=1 Tax=Elongatibacter sediminis TaxID=3119006 RepID=A0AAW9RFZ6_9GAMM
MDYFPLFMNIRDLPVLLVGAGRVAERKARLLLAAGGEVRVVARSLNGQFRHWQENGDVRWLAAEWSDGLLDDARLVIAATADTELNRRVYDAAESAGVPVNVVDDKALCRFITPAMIDRSPVQVAIATGGSSPVLARRIRGWIERLLPLGLGRVALAAGRARERVKQVLPPERRRGFWEGVLTEQHIRRLSLQSDHEIDGQIGRRLDAAAGDDSTANGRVSLVGAGPGRADLLTLRALHVLGQADVVLHDRLVSDEVLDLARRDADRIDVGKRAGNHHRTQEQIHELMVSEARKGRHVVRLKGGDPFIFGRGGEELEFLRDHGIAYEVVPGITAAAGCAAYSGIPLTHRKHAQSLSFVTGHLADALAESDGSGIDWGHLAGPGRTAVVYMGVRQAAALRDRLLGAGIDPALPVALVISGTSDRQQVFHGVVDELPRLASRAPRGEPGLLIIGQVASLGSTLGWLQVPAELQSAA